MPHVQRFAIKRQHINIPDSDGSLNFDLALIRGSNEQTMYLVYMLDDYDIDQ